MQGGMWDVRFFGLDFDPNQSGLLYHSRGALSGDYVAMEWVHLGPPGACTCQAGEYMLRCKKKGNCVVETRNLLGW